MPEKTKFQIEINGGKTQEIETTTGQYNLAAIAALALCEYDHNEEYDVVKIWVPKLVEGGYGPYFYAFDGQNIGLPTADREW